MKRYNIACLISLCLITGIISGCEKSDSDKPKDKFDLNSFPTADNTGIKGVGLSESDLLNSHSIHVYADRVVSNGEKVTSEHNLVKEGRITISDNGVTIERLNIDDGVYIYENVENTSIRKCKIMKGSYAVKCDNNSSNTLIEDCTITNDLVQGEYNEHGLRKGILAANCTIRRCDIGKYADGIYMANNVTIEDCYIHDLYFYNPAWDGKPGDMTHSDGVQSAGGVNYTIKHNRIEATGKNSAIILSNLHGNCHNVLIENNWMTGGNYTVYITKRADANGDYTLKNITMKDNILYHEDERHVIADNTDIVNYTGNRMESGELLSVNPE